VPKISNKDANETAAKPDEPVRVAILDDDPSIRTSISRFLKAWDLHVNAYATCVEFMHGIADNRPDCLLLDLHMPEFDGIAVMNHLNYTKVGLPVIVISAEEETKFRDVCYSLGAIRYLRKPLNGAELLSAIEEAVGVV
jgi:FixJ family two-component response regulator